MKDFKVYSGSICIGRVKAKSISIAMKKAIKTFRHAGIWVRSI